MYATDTPYGQHYDKDGSPLTGGQVFYGVANQNPETSPVQVYWDSAGTAPAAQPIRVLNGYASRDGTPALIYVGGTYSMLVRNARGEVVFYLPDSSSLPSALEGRLADSSSPSLGAAMVAYNQLLDYPSGSTGYRHRQVFSAKNAGCDVAGDVYVNLSAHLAAAASIGADFEFTAGRTYQLGQALTFPAGMSVFTKGAVFEDLNGSVSDTSFITIGANSFVDTLSVTIPTGKQRDRAIRLNGDGATIGTLKLIATSQQVNSSDLSDAGLSILANNITIGQVIVEGYDRAIRINGNDITIGHLQQSKFCRGTWIIDGARIRILSGYSHTLSPNAVLEAGNNAFLIGCDTVGATRDIWLENQVIEASGEHGIRIGGPKTIRNVWINDVAIRGVGACGIKCLGTDTGTPTDYNYNIIIDSPVIEDCGTSTTASNNRCGILAEFVAGLKIIEPTIRPRNETYCASFGIRVNASNDVTVTNPTIHGAQYDNIVVDTRDADISRFHLVGGNLYNAARHALNVLVSAGMTLRNCHINGTLLQSAGSLGLNVNVTGSAIDVVVAARAHNNTGGAVACNSNNVGLDIIGAPGGSTPMSGVSATNSSIWRDGTTLNVRKAGAWVAL